MAVRPIVMHPDEMLRRVCDPVTAGDAVALLAEDMLETMYAAKGRGLAAPQVGVPWRVFVFDAAWKSGTPEPFVCLNPEVEPLGAEMRRGAELCLSIPERPVDVTRPARVRLRWQGLDGMPVARDFTGDAAVIVQHETDHLDGRLIIDRLSQ